MQVDYIFWGQNIEKESRREKKKIPEAHGNGRD
jgi:hypothetical protein